MAGGKTARAGRHGGTAAGQDLCMPGRPRAHPAAATLHSFLCSDMGTVVMGKSEAGVVKKGDSLMVMPNK